MLTITDVAELLDVDRRWVSARVRSGELPARRDGTNVVWIDPDDLGDFVENMRMRPGSIATGRLPPKPKLGVDELAQLDARGWTDEQIADALRPRTTAEKVASWGAHGLLSTGFHVSDG